MKVGIDRIVSESFCLGCGSCGAVNNGSYQINDYGMSLPILNEQIDDDDVCPFSNSIKSELSLSKKSFGDQDGILFNKYIGYYLGLFAGHVNVGPFRRSGTSGGITKWLLCKLMHTGEINGVIHVIRGRGDNLFKYGVSRSVEQIKQASQSAYYSVNFSESLNEVLEEKGDNRYAFVGVPCYCKAMNLLKNKYPAIKKKIPYTIGVLCGHMKTKNYAKLLSWEAGLDPNDLRYINFRDKDPNKDKNAADYNFFGNDSQKSRSRKKSSLKAANYNIPHLKFKACDFCEDVFGYCADVVTGDAWINPYVKNPRGTNVLITRNARLHDLILQFRGDQLDLDDISEEQLIESQSSSFSHRIEEIGYRLFKSKKENQWSPNKASSEKRLKENRESIQNLREEIREKSHKYFKEALDNNDLASYFNEVNPLVEKLNSFYG